MAIFNSTCFLCNGQGCQNCGQSGTLRYECEKIGHEPNRTQKKYSSSSLQKEIAVHNTSWRYTQESTEFEEYRQKAFRDYLSKQRNQNNEPVAYCYTDDVKRIPAALTEQAFSENGLRSSIKYTIIKEPNEDLSVHYPVYETNHPEDISINTANIISYKNSHNTNLEWAKPISCYHVSENDFSCFQKAFTRNKTHNEYLNEIKSSVGRNIPQIKILSSPILIPDTQKTSNSFTDLRQYISTDNIMLYDSNASIDYIVEKIACRLEKRLSLGKRLSEVEQLSSANHIAIGELQKKGAFSLSLQVPGVPIGVGVDLQFLAKTIRNFFSF